MHAYAGAVCASYGLTSESRRRIQREQEAALLDLLAEPEAFDEQEDLRGLVLVLPPDLEAWLDEHDRGPA